MNYTLLFTQHHIAMLYDWLTESGELFVRFEYPHGGCGGDDYLVHSLENLHNLMSRQTARELDIYIFRAIVFPIRGNDYSALLQRALLKIPEGLSYQIVALPPHTRDSRHLRPHECELLECGNSHDELRKDIANLEPGREIAIGVHPFDGSYEEFEQFYGRPIEQLSIEYYYERRTSLNQYDELSNNPAKYQDSIRRWYAPAEPDPGSRHHTSLPERLPTFDELPIKPNYPPHSAWGLFGEEDEIGTLNLLTPERVAAAARLVQSGEVFPMNWELELPRPPLFNRSALRHTIHRRRQNVFDDIYDDFNTQSSSQWDGLRHYGHAEHGFYNGVTEEQIADPTNSRNGIHHWARRGIAGRGVLIDFQRFTAAHGITYSPGVRYGITPEQMQAAAAWQGLSFQTGDILLLRVGWIEWYSSLDEEQRTQLAQPGGMQVAGMAQGEESLRFLWDNHFAAIASDNPSFEANPFAGAANAPPGEAMHNTIIGLWGMPIGEMFQLDALARACAADHRYEFFFTSAPLNKLGGIASPPNALAIK